MKETVLDGALALAFLASVAFQLALAIGLARRRPRMRAVWCLLFPPLAPYWGLEQGMRIRALGWGVSVASYTAVRLMFAWLSS